MTSNTAEKSKTFKEHKLLFFRLIENMSTLPHIGTTQPIPRPGILEIKDR